MTSPTISLRIHILYPPHCVCARKSIKITHWFSQLLVLMERQFQWLAAFMHTSIWINPTPSLPNGNESWKSKISDANTGSNDVKSRYSVLCEYCLETVFWLSWSRLGFDVSLSWSWHITESSVSTTVRVALPRNWDAACLKETLSPMQWWVPY